ncbi:VRR-NUC domain-containing protein [uncultured Peptoniphilus sp.]|uniref:VRR-NUC domain-containing protein n=1 Tax=uncultured Peptoniphilus sp. TaxID=254354 RepID=UPI002803C6E5|nr:VRR-NUC domain-containing protein [uncultured Peptoniphilus sp.]
MGIKDGYDLTGKPIPEKTIQDQIRTALSYYCHVYRANVGVFKQGSRFISTGLPKGFPDLFGFRHKDGKFFVIEVKNIKGRLSPEQIAFGKEMAKYNILYGVARSIEDAFKIVEIEV